MRKGLHVSIYKNPLFKGCSIGGVSEGHDKATLLPSEDFPDVPEISPPTDDAPAIVMVKRRLFDGVEPYLTAYPADKDGKPDSDMRMFGGAFIHTSDGRFPAQYPVPLHDRKE